MILVHWVRAYQHSGTSTVDDLYDEEHYKQLFAIVKTSLDWWPYNFADPTHALIMLQWHGTTYAALSLQPSTRVNCDVVLVVESRSEFEQFANSILMTVV